MRKIYALVFLISALFLWQAAGTHIACAQESGGGTDSENSLMATTSTDDADLEAEAGQLGIPASETTRYVVDAKSLNKRYQQGSLTQTEYIGAKRELIERLK